MILILFISTCLLAYGAYELSEALSDNSSF